MPRRRITFRQLETFATVARLNSFTRAAEELHLTQPAVSIQIRQISETIGLSLFEQNGREMALTSAGTELLATVRRLMQHRPRSASHARAAALRPSSRSARC